MMRTYVSKTELRRRLGVTTAMAGGLFVAGAPAPAQVTAPLPTGPSTPGLVTTDGPNMTVTLNDSRTIINWNSFDIDTGNSVTFTDGAAVDLKAVLNRDLSGAMNDTSVINGELRADNNISVYLINTSGITFGAGADVNVGALIASTLDLDATERTDFLNGDSITFSAATGSQAAVLVNSGATISTVDGLADLGELVLLGAQVTVAGGAALNAGSEAAIVAGTTVTMPSNPSSPLSFTIAEGTEVAAAVTVNGQVSGRNVTLAFASRDTFTDALLIGSSGIVTATSATATDRGVVLAAGTSSLNGVVTVEGTAAVGTANIIVNGTITADETIVAPSVDSEITADVVIRARNDISGTGSISADDNVIISSDLGAVNFTGPIRSDGNTTISTPGAVTLDDVASSGGNVSISGGSVTLPAAQITATSGNVVVSGATVITGASAVSGTSATFNGTVSGDGAAGDDTLTVTTTGAANFTGAVGTVGGELSGLAVDAGTATFGSTDNRVGTLAADVTSGGLNFTNDQTLTVGSVGSLSGITVGSGGVSLTTQGSGSNLVVASDVNAAGQTITLNSAATLSGAPGVELSADDIVLTFADFGPDILTNAALQETDDLSITDTSGALTLSSDLSAAGDLVMTAQGTDLTTSNLAAGGNVTLSAARDLTLQGNVDATNDIATLTAGGAISQTDTVGITAATLTGSAGGAAILDGTNQVTNLGNFSAGSLALNDVGGLTVTGAVTGTGGVTITTSGALTVANGGSLGATDAGIGLTTSDAGAGDEAITLNGAVNAGTGTVTLTSAGTIGQTATGTITAGTLTGSSVGGTTLTAAPNAITNLGAFTNTGSGGIALNDVGALNVTGAVSGTGLVSLSTSGAMGVTTGSLAGSAITLVTTTDGNGATDDGMSFNGAVNGGAGTVSLTSAGMIGQTATGTITAGTLTGSSVGGTTLTAAPNAITNLGAFTNTGSGGFSLVDSTALTVTGNVNSGPGALRITAPSMTFSGQTLTAGTDALLEATTGNVTGTGATTAPVVLAGRDIAIKALSGAVTTGALSAGDDIAVRSGGVVTTGNLTSGTAPLNAGAGSADDLVAGETPAVSLAGNDIDIGGSSISVGRARAIGTGSDIRLRGPVTAAAGDASDDCGPDLCVDADGDILITGFADARDVALRAGGTVTTAEVRAQDDIAIRAGGAVTTGNLTSGFIAGGGMRVDTDSSSSDPGAADTLVANNGPAGVSLAGNDVDILGTSISVGTVVANGTGSDIRLRGPMTGSNGPDIDLSSGGNIELGGLAQARDVALNAGGSVAAQEIRATDDIAIRAVGTVATGALTSGVAPATETEPDASAPFVGAADRLVNSFLAGHDIDIAVSDVASSINVGQVRANGEAGQGTSDIRLTLATGSTGRIRGPGAAGEGDLDLDADGDVLLTGAADGRDVALYARGTFGGGTVMTSAITARDDIAIRASGQVTTGNLTSGVVVGTRIDDSGAADTLVGNTLPAGVSLSGNDIDIGGTSISVGRARAIGSDSDIRLRGPVTGDRGDASDDCGLDLCLDADGDVIIDGAADGRDIAIRAGRDIRTAALSADDDIVLGAGRDITTGALISGNGEVGSNAVGAGDQAAGSTFTLTDGGNILAVATGNILVRDATSGELATISSDLDVALVAGGVVATANQTALDDITVRAGGNITTGDLTSGAGMAADDGVGAADRIAGQTLDDGNIFVVGNGAIMTGVLISGADIALAAGGGITTARQEARDDIVIRAGGLVATGALTSGTPTNANDPVGAAEALFAERPPAAGEQRVDLVGHDIDIRANGVQLGPVRANGFGSDVLIDGGSDGIGILPVPVEDLDIRSDGNIRLTGTVRARDVALGAGGSVTTDAVVARDDIAIRANGVVATGSLTTGNAADVDASGAADTLVGPLAGNDIDIRGSRVTVSSASTGVGSSDMLGAESDLRLFATADQLTLGTGSVAGKATLTKEGADRELQVTTLTAGTADGSTGDITITSSTHARLADVTSETGVILVEALNGQVTGLTRTTPANDGSTAPFFDRANLTTQAETKDITVRAGTLAQFGQVSAGQDLSVTAGTATLDGTVNLLTGLGRDVALEARRGSVIARTVTADDDIAIRASLDISSGTLTSGKEEAAGVADTLAGTSLLGGGSILSTAGRDIVSGGTITSDVDIALEAVRNVTTVGDLAARDDIAIRAGGTISTGTLRSGAPTTTSPAPTDAEGSADALVTRTDMPGNDLIGNDIDVRGGSVLVATAETNRQETALGRQSELRLTATAGQLTLGTGTIGGAATLTKQGSDGELQVTDALTTGLAGRPAASDPAGNATITSSTNARLANVTSETGSVRVDALNGQVTGVAGGRANLRAPSLTVDGGVTVGEDVIVRAGTLALLGTVAAGRDVSVTAGNMTTPLNGSIDITDGSGRDIALNAVGGAVGGTVTAGTLSARDDIAIRASGAVAAGTLNSGVAPAVDQEGVADALVTDNPLDGNDIDVRGASVAVSTALAGRDAAAAMGRQSDLRLVAATGRLVLGTGTVGGTTTLDKQGAAAVAGNELQVGTLTSGTAADAVGTVSIRSATDARLGTVEARGGAIDIRAGVDAGGTVVRDGDVTGLAGSSNGLDAGHGRAVLTAARSRDASGAMNAGTDRSVTVNAGGLVQLAAVTAGTDITVTAGSQSVADGAIDISVATARRGALGLTAVNGDVRLGTSNAGGTVATDDAAGLDSSAGTTARLTAARDVVVGRSLTANGSVSNGNVELTSGRDVLLAAAPYEVRSVNADVIVTAARNVTGLPAGGDDTGEAGVAGSGLRAGTVTSDGDVLIDGAGNVRLREATSTAEDVTVTAGGSVTGLSNFDSGDGISGAGRLFGGRDVVVTAGPLARLTLVDAGRDASVTADMVAVGSADAGRNLVLTARGSGLHLGTGIGGSDAGFVGTVSLRTSQAGTLATPPAGVLGNAAAADRDTLDTAHGFANLTASAANRTVTVTAGTVTPGVASFGAAQLGTVTAGAGTGAAAGLDQVSVTADRLTVASATAANGALVLASREGPLYLGTGSAGTSATLTKQGAADFAGNELRVRGSLTGGTATGAVGDVSIGSATDVRLATVTARNGLIDVRAGVDAGVAVRDGDVTGIAGAASNGLDAGHGRAVLSADVDVLASAGGLVQLGRVTAGRDISVTAGSSGVADRDGAIDISRAAAGRALTLTAYNDSSDANRLADVRLGTSNAGGTAATDGAADLDSSAGTTVRLTTQGTRGDVVVGRSLTANGALGDGNVELTSVRDVLMAAAPYEVRSVNADVIVTAARNVTGLPAGGNDTGEATANGGQLRAGTVASGSDVLIDGAGDVRLREATSANGDVVVNAGGSATGLSTSDSGDEISGAGRLFAARDVTVTANGLARLSEVGAGDDVSVDAGTVAVGAATAGDSLTLIADGGLHLGTGSAGGVTTLTTGQAGTLTTPTADQATNVLDTGYGFANLAARDAGDQRDRRVTVTASRVAQLGTVTAGAAAEGATETTTERSQISVTADALTVREATAVNGSLALTARDGALYLDTGRAATTATLEKRGAAAVAGNELRVRTRLTSGGDTRITSATNAQLNEIRSTGANISVDAVNAANAVTLNAARAIGVSGGSVGIGTAAAGSSLDVLARSGQLTLGTGTAGTTATLTKQGSEGQLQATTLTAGDDATINSSTNATLGTVTSTRGNILADATNTLSAGTLTAAGGIAASGGTALIGSAAAGGSVGITARSGQLTLGTGTAGTTATLTKQGGAGELQVTNALTSGGNATVSSATNARLANVTSRTGDVLVTAAGEVTGVGTDGRGNLTAEADGKDVTVTAGTNVRLNAATAGNDLRVSAGNAATGSVGSIDITTAAARTGLLALSAVNGNVVLGTGTAAATSDLTTSGSGSVSVVTSLTSGGNITIGSADDATLALVRSTGGNVSVTAVDAIGAGTVTAAGSVGVTGNSISAGTVGAGTSLAMTARTGQLTLGTGTSGTTSTLTKQGSAGEMQVTSLSSGGTATLTSSTSQRLGTIESRSADVIASATSGSITGLAAGSDFTGADLQADGRVQLRGGATGLVRLSDVAATRGDIDIQAGSAAGATSQVEILDAVSARTSYRVMGGSITLGGDAGAETQAAGGAVELTALSGAVTGGPGLTLQSNSDGSGAETVIITANGASGAVTFAADNRVLGGTSGAGSNVTIDTVGRATLAQVTAAGQTITINANDLELQGASAGDLSPRVTATTVAITNRADASALTRLGDNVAGSGGFALSQAEINRIGAQTVSIESGTQDVAIGDLALTTGVGANRLNIQGLGRVDVTGTVSATGSPATRTIQIGGTGGQANGQDPRTLASVIAVAPASTGGGRLLLGDANLDLRGNVIGMGQAALLSAIGVTGGSPQSTETVNRNFISNPNSILYNPTPPYSDPIILTANTLSVTYSGFAVFQNTAQALAPPSGVDIGALSVKGTLSLASSGDNAPNGFAIFGVINGATGNQAALLGPEVLPLNGVNRGETRINGCLIGGGGCLVTTAGTPNVAVFDERQANILQTADDLEIPFDPIVGTNNEALFTGLSSIDEMVEPEPDCEAEPEAPQCREPQVDGNTE